MQLEKNKLQNAVKSYGRYINAEHSLGNDNYNLEHYQTDNKHLAFVCQVKTNIFGLFSNKKPTLTDVILYCRTKGITIISLFLFLFLNHAVLMASEMPTADLGSTIGVDVRANLDGPAKMVNLDEQDRLMDLEQAEQ